MPAGVASSETVEVAVVGGGPAGFAAGIACALSGIETALIAPRAEGDNRTTALLTGSVTALEGLGVWSRCRERAAPLAAMRIVDDRGGLLRAPEVLFRAEEIGLSAFGHNVENRCLMAALAARAAVLPTLRLVDRAVTELVHENAARKIVLQGDQTLRAKLVIGADGRESLCRRAAGIAIDRWSYPQVALTCNLAHGRPHHGVSTEFHTAAGPFTLVPLPGQRSSLVWVVGPAVGERLGALDDVEFSAAVERQAHSLLGKMRVEGPRAAFLLSGQTARRLAGDRIALVGEAAHVMPPIGAQGFNLGLRDVAALVELLVEARRRGGDPGGSELLQRYENRRRIDVRSRTAAIDLLNRSLLTDFIPLQGLRGFGLYLMDRIGPLRRMLMREGIASRFDEPKLMRGEPL